MRVHTKVVGALTLSSFIFKKTTTQFIDLIIIKATKQNQIYRKKNEI